MVAFEVKTVAVPFSIFKVARWVLLLTLVIVLSVVSKLTNLFIFRR